MVRLAALIIASWVAFTAVAHADVIKSSARVIDGDTLEVGSTIVRLAGIDAPELGQSCEGPEALRKCGKVAADFLAERIEGQRIECDVAGLNTYGRAIASCSHEGEDVSGWMVREAFALAFVRYSDRYVAEEEAARTRQSGLWRATVQPPWEYRAERWAVAEQEAPEGCAIKGNISRESGDHIYHVPWSSHYKRTKISVGKGERCFCSEGEALAAGWRPPKR